MKHKHRLFLIPISIVAAFALSACSNILPNRSERPSSSEITESSKAETVRVTFDTNGGSYVAPQEVEVGKTITKPRDPTRKGYVFAAWIYNDSDWDFNTPVYRDTQLKARWRTESSFYTATFLNDDKSILDYQTDLFYGDPIYYNGPTPIKVYQEPNYIYTFVGWDKELVVMGDMIFNAIYEREYHEEIEPISDKWSYDETGHWHADNYNYGNKYDYAEHDFVYLANYSTQATCYSSGQNAYRCKTCGYMKYDYINPSHNFFLNGSYHSDGDFVSYNMYKCKFCSAEKMEIAAIDGVFSSQLQSGTPDQYIKLKSNGDSAFYTFDLYGYSSGTIYFNAMIDNYSVTKTYGYYSTSGNPSDHHYSPHGNFELTVNDIMVDYSHLRGVTYSDMFANGADEYVGSGYSPTADCEVGSVRLAQGINTIKFTRLDKYNPLIKKIIITLNPGYEDIHSPNYNIWNYDNEGHWHPCYVDDGERFEYSSHIFDSYREVEEATCTNWGSGIYRCSICGYERWESIAPLGHYYYGQDAYSAPTGEATVGHYDSVCLRCGQKRIAINAQEGVLADGSSFKYAECNPSFVRLSANGDSIIYTFNYNSYAYGKIYFRAISDNWPSYQWMNYYSTKNGEVNYEKGNFELIVNDSIVDYYEMRNTCYYDMFGGSVQYDDGVNSYSCEAECEIGSVQLVPGLNTISFTRLSSYTLFVSFFDIVVKDSSTPHDHIFNNNDYVYDGDYHWHRCYDCGATLDKEAHMFTGYVYDQQPTCTEYGQGYRSCVVCGFTEWSSVDPLGHDYQEIHRDDNYITEQCTRCGETRQISIASPFEHNFVKEPYHVHAYDEGCVGYDCAYCDSCSAKGITINAEDATFINCTNKSGTLEGFVKLSQNGGVASYSFVYDSYASGYLYIRAIEDNWTSSSNKQAGLYQASDKQYDEPNTKFEVNGVEVDSSQLKGFSYSDLLPEDDGSHGSNYSGVGTIKIGYIQLVPGINTITFTRVRSYTPLINALILAVEDVDSNHEHAFDAYTYNESFHWRDCLNGCGIKDSYEQHTFSEATVLREPTCSEYGSSIRHCIICGYSEYVQLEPTGHDFSEVIYTVPATCQQEGIIVYKCSHCGEELENTLLLIPHNTTVSGYNYNDYGQEITKLVCLDCGLDSYGIDFDSYYTMSGSYSGSKPGKGSEFHWQFTGIAPGRYALQFPMGASSESSAQNGKLKSEEYSVFVNGVEQSLYSYYDSYISYNILANQFTDITFCEIIVDDSGVVDIQLNCNCSSYRPLFSGYVKLSKIN